MTEREARYSVEVLENGRRLSARPIVDPFINTRVHPGGGLLGRLMVALQVLRGTYEVEVIVRGDSAIVEQVLELDPDYLGAWGSERRRQWDANLNNALASFAGADDDDDDDR